MLDNDAALTELARSLGDGLLQRDWLVATAESCTGGWVAKVITEVAGSSAWFDRGFVCYSNQAKTDMLGVEMSLLHTEGAVSAACVTAMARGALRFSRAQLSVAITGIAGPGGGSPQKPVGSVWLGWAKHQAEVHCAQYRFAGDRHAIRRQAVLTALQGLVQHCYAQE
ncbi:MAG: nicotinamide-nucleotide amidohydrolase family protein [Gammaproteobacteria bacterium]|nr:nicotinamide-nucleotide amidohydrolase family protein [Gammaproteobacteria bacterium]